MAEIKGFIKYQRKNTGYRPIEERVKDFNEVELVLSPEDIFAQAARCVDCGIPFCHGIGCPLGNNIPEFNDLVYKGQWEKACAVLHMTNNFPEITGRICPAPCETACTLAINDDPVFIRHIEFQIVEKGFEQGWIRPILPKTKTGKRVAIIGSGPSGLTTAQQLTRMGHEVVVFEKHEKCGGMLRYGIPDFKLDKSVVDRRLDQLTAEGVQFQTGVDVGIDISAHYLKKRFDVICLTMGAWTPRDLPVQGRDLENVVYAMDFLSDQNKLNSGEITDSTQTISAKNKNIVVVGGGDTGSDCVGTSIRQGAKSVTQLEILPKPPEIRPDDTPWPNWPRTMRTSSSHQEGCDRKWSVKTVKLSGADTKVTKLCGCQVEWTKKENGSWDMKDVPGSEFELKADIIILAMGFLHVQHPGIVKDLGLELDQRGNIIMDTEGTNQTAIFAAGDSVAGASLVVRAIDSGRKVADNIDTWLKNKGTSHNT